MKLSFRLSKGAASRRLPGFCQLALIAFLTVAAPCGASRQEGDRDTAKTQTGAFLVCIDPGHPSETSAGTSANGLSEKRICWQVAERLTRLLKKMGIAYVLTKNSEDQLVTNRQRAEIANKNGAALFLRLHCDTGGGHGYAWYFPDHAATKQGVTGPPAEVQRASRQAVQILNDAMKPVLRGRLQSNAIKTDGATFVGGKQGGVLTGSIFSRVPTALIEMCFLNQKSDAKVMGSPEGQEKMAEALATAILAYRNRAAK